MYFKGFQVGVARSDDGGGCDAGTGAEWVASAQTRSERATRYQPYLDDCSGWRASRTTLTILTSFVFRNAG